MRCFGFTWDILLMFSFRSLQSVICKPSAWNETSQKQVRNKRSVAGLRNFSSVWYRWTDMLINTHEVRISVLISPSFSKIICEDIMGSYISCWRPAFAKCWPSNCSPKFMKLSQTFWFIVSDDLFPKDLKNIIIITRIYFRAFPGINIKLSPSLSSSNNWNDIYPFWCCGQYPTPHFCMIYSGHQKYS